LDWVFVILLFLHIGGAILAFGPTYGFPLMQGIAGGEPQHLNFALRVQKKIASSLVTPLALFQGLTGLLLVWRIGFDVLREPWLIISIALYVVALAISFTVLYPALRVLIPATSAPPPAPAEGAAPAGPPPHIVRARDRAKLGGMVNSVLILVIVALMISGPRGFLSQPLF
jgi:uncharacterized membrane protein